MLTIRLQRTGKRNQADFRVVLAEKTSAVNKKFSEVLGSYNPKTKDLKIKNPERLTYWIEQHVAISPTVHNLLVTKNLLKATKVKAFSTPKKPVVAEAAPVASAEEAAAAPVEEKPVEEAPVTEVAAE
jgi:small subunit ribosomal protein S16